MKKDSWLYRFYQKRVKQDRDLTVLITDDANERGTGKTTLALKLAAFFDRTKEGMTKEKATLNAEEIEEAYTEHPKGSSLILDEAEEGLSKYRASSNINKAMRDLISQGRLLQKYTIFTAPYSGAIDNDLKALFDVWILVQKRGKGKVNYCNYNSYRDHPLYTQKESIWWSDIDDPQLTEVYEYLADEKDRRLRGKEENEEEEEQDIPREVRQEVRNELIEDMYENDGMTQGEIGELVGLSRSRIADIIKNA
jgi:predicted XRE-type DNA-binding protein